MSQGSERMPRYTYRTLRVSHWDKHGDPTKKRGGDKPDRILYVRDSSKAQIVDFPDKRGEDLWAFNDRTGADFLTYLNQLGEEGWQVVSYHNTSQDPAHGQYPNDNFLLVRIE